MEAKTYFELSMENINDINKMPVEHRINYINYCELLLTLKQYDTCLQALNAMENAKPVYVYGIDKVIGSIYYLKAEVLWFLNKREDSWEYLERANAESYLFPKYKSRVNEYLNNTQHYNDLKANKIETLILPENKSQTKGYEIELINDNLQIKSDSINKTDDIIFNCED